LQALSNIKTGMEPRIETLTEKKLIGKHLTMSLAANKTGELWKSFMQRRSEIQNNVGDKLYSMQVHGPGYFESFDPHKTFEKWATTEVSNFNEVPSGMETFVLPGGLYAVFLYKGNEAGAGAMFQYIFANWLPASNYGLDNRPHFEVLDEKYKNGEPDSEEEIWIPIKNRQ
jgi:AraC family transcriptional regulator